MRLPKAATKLSGLIGVQDEVKASSNYTSDSNFLYKSVGKDSKSGVCQGIPNLGTKSQW